MDTPLVSGAAAMLVTAVAAPVVRELMLRTNTMDVPNHRSSHVIPTPRGGGWACLAGALVGWAVSTLVDERWFWVPVALASILALVGAADDRTSLSPEVRLGAQAACGVVGGVAVLGAAGILVGPLVYMCAVNIVNFMDGVNGITSLTVLVWSATVVVAGTRAEVPDVVTLGAITAGAAAGFLPWNAPRARVFLGDVGSYLFGGLIAGGVVLGLQSGLEPLVLVAPLAVYVADTGTTLVRRAARREKLSEAHREHAYQRLAASGLPHVAVAGIAAVAALVCAGSAVLLSTAPALAACLATCVGFVALPSMPFTRRAVGGSDSLLPPHHRRRSGT